MKWIIEARELSRFYRAGSVSVAGIHRVDLRVCPGEIVLVKGASGSGKSTLLSLLGGLDRPTGGSLIVAGVDLTGADEKALTRFRGRSVGMVFQSFNLLPTMTVLENVCLPALLSGESKRDAARRGTEILERLNMGARITHYPSQLSGGQMQRTAAARALINDPPIILADEPTGNLDSRNGRNLMDLLVSLAGNAGRTLIIATHSDLADSQASRTLILRDGSPAEPQ